MDNDKWCLSINDVYGTVPTVAPEGYEFTGEFRPPKQNEFWLLQSRDVAMQSSCNFGPSYPRLILHEKPAEPKPEDIYTVSEEILRGRNYPGFEWTGEFRKLKFGDYFLSAPLGTYVEEVRDARYTRGAGAYRFVMRKLPTIKDIYGKELSDLKAPEGYRFTGEFRKVQEGDYWFMPTVSGGLDCGPCKPNQLPNMDGNPRLILEKIPVNPTIEEVYGTPNPVIPKGWRFKEFREVNKVKEPKTKILGNLNVQRVYDAEHMGYGPPPWRIVLEEVQDLSQFKYAIGPETVYGTKLPEVPEGYRVVDFRPLRKGDLFIESSAPYCASEAVRDFPNNTRLILERL